MFSKETSTKHRANYVRHPTLATLMYNRHNLKKPTFLMKKVRELQEFKEQMFVVLVVPADQLLEKVPNTSLWVPAPANALFLS